MRKKVLTIDLPDSVTVDEDKNLDEVLIEPRLNKLLFESFFEISNRLRALEGRQPITRAQLKNWFKNKLKEN